MTLPRRRKTCPKCPRCNEPHEGWMEDSKGIGWGVPVVSLCCECLSAFEWNTGGEPRYLKKDDPRLVSHWMIKAANANDDGTISRHRRSNKLIWWYDDAGKLRAETASAGFVSCATREDAEAELEKLRPWAGSHSPKLYLWVVPVMIPRTKQDT